VKSRGPIVWQIFEVPTFCSSRPVVNVDAKLTFSSEVKQIALDDLKCRLRDGTKVSCVDVTACFEYSGIGIERRLGENFRSSAYKLSPTHLKLIARTRRFRNPAGAGRQETQEPANVLHGPGGQKLDQPNAQNEQQIARVQNSAGVH
jgi:Integrin alpha